jgi:hypothetical protein
MKKRQSFAVLLLVLVLLVVMVPAVGAVAPDYGRFSGDPFSEPSSTSCIKTSDDCGGQPTYSFPLR